MEIVAYSPRISARRHEDHSDLLLMQRARVVEYYYAAMLLQFRDIQTPQNMETCDYNPMPITLYTRGTQEEHLRTTPEFTIRINRRYGDKWVAWLAGVSAYVGMYALLVTYNQLKQTDPFESHLGFIIMSIAAFFMTLITSGIVFYTNNLQNVMKDHYYYPVFDIILKILLWFNAILAPLSLVLLLFIPPGYNWTGYMIVCALFVGVLAFNFKSLKRANNLRAFEMV